MKRTGYIEGYFGRILSHEQRIGILEHLSLLNMNTYLYAPKEDPYHRVQWKVPYPASEQRVLEELASKGRSLDIDVVPALAPGLSYDYLSDEHYAILLGKFERYFEMGITIMALLMDDLVPELPSTCQGSFNSLGDAHGKLLIRLQSDLRKVEPTCDLLFCPTVYSDYFVEGEAADSDYIKDLAAIIPDDIPIFWTGDQVVSETIGESNTGRIRELFKDNLIIWDNYYANDYTPYRIFIGPMLGRDKEFTDRLTGFMINPTGLYVTDKMLLSLTEEFLRTGANDLASWRRATKEFALHPDIEKVLPYYWSPFTTTDRDFPTAEQAEGLKSFYDEVVVAWQNPLRLEWFQYLIGLITDLQLLYADYGKTDKWINNYYTGAVTRYLPKRE